MTSSCGRARRALWPDAGPRDASTDVIEARSHVATCGECQAFFDDMARVADHVAAAAAKSVAPREVRERVFQSVALGRAGRTEARRRILVIGAAAVIGTMVLALFARVILPAADGSAPHALTQALLENHTRSVYERGIESRDRGEVARWLATQLTFSVHIPVFADAPLRGARVTVVQAQQGAVLEYDVGGTTISYFVVPAPHDASHEGAPRFMYARRSGYQVLMWREPGLVHAFVGNVGRTRLELLAESCIAQARAALAAATIPFIAVATRTPERHRRSTLSDRFANGNSRG